MGREGTERVLRMKKGLVLSIFASIGVLIFYPALNSFCYWDDFPLMCMSRYIGNPLSFFTQDYFPGSVSYRPLGMLSWWLSYRLFGLNPTLHNLLNPLLHVINTFLLYLLLGQLFDKKRWMILFSSLLFLVHPVTISTSLWQSDRFDLMATLFILLTLYLFFRFLSTHRRIYLISSLLGACLGILSKEISYGLCLLITLVVFTFPNLKVKSEWVKKVFLLLPYYLITLFLFVIRFLLLRGAEGAYFENGLLRSISNGFLRWIDLMPDIYLSHVDVLRTGDFVKGISLLFVLLLPVVIFLSIKREKPVPWHLFLLGFGVIGISGLLMAPVMNLSTFVKPGEEFSFFVIAEGRFYYLSLIGFLIILNSSLFLVSSFSTTRRGAQWYSALMVSFFTIAFFPYAVSSFSLGQKWKELTNGGERHLVELADQAVRQAPSMEPGMKIYFLNTQSHSHFREFGDTVLKAIAPQNSKVIHCLVFTEKPPWYNLVLKEDVGSIEIQPLRNLRRRGKEVPPTVVGDFAHFYLVFPGGVEIAKDPRAVFFEFLAKEKRFIDVTEKVRAGTKKVPFFNDRPET
jgi:hypothetical protein